MIRLILVLLFLLIFFIISLPLFIIEEIIGHFNKDKQARSSFIIVMTALRIIRWLSGTKLTVIGEENVPRDQAVLFVANHRSYFDIVTLYPLTNKVTGFVAKKELARIPILRRWMKYMHCEFLDRENIKAGLQSILNCIATVKSGTSICIFPEGTRSPGDEMLEFKEGSFKIAEKSGCLIVPVAISNTEAIFEAHMPFIKRAQVTICFGKPIDMKALPREERKHIGASTQAIVADMLVQNARLTASAK